MTPPDLLTRARQFGVLESYERQALEAVTSIERCEASGCTNDDCPNALTRKLLKYADNLVAEIERLTQEVARFSTLADERHDALFACHRERDMDRAVMAKLTQELVKAEDAFISAKLEHAGDLSLVQREQAIRQRLRAWLEQRKASYELSSESQGSGPSGFEFEGSAEACGEALSELTRLEQAPAPTPTRREE